MTGRLPSLFPIWARFGRWSMLRRIGALCTALAIVLFALAALLWWLITSSYYIHGSELRGMKWDPSGKRLAVFYDDGVLDLLTYHDGGGYSAQRIRSPDKEGLRDFEWSPDGTKLAVALSYKGMRVYEFDGTGGALERMVSLPGGSPSTITDIYWLLWSPDGNMLSALDGNNTMKQLIVIDGHTYHAVPTGASQIQRRPAIAQKWTSSNRLAIKDEGYSFWDPSYPEKLQSITLPKEIHEKDTDFIPTQFTYFASVDLMLSPDDTMIVFPTDYGGPCVYDLVNQRMVLEANDQDRSLMSSWSPTSNAIVFGGMNTESKSPQLVIRRFPAKEFAETKIPPIFMEVNPTILSPNYDYRFYQLLWSPDGQRLATGFTREEPPYDNTPAGALARAAAPPVPPDRPMFILTIWDATTGKILAQSNIRNGIPAPSLDGEHFKLISGMPKGVVWSPQRDKAALSIEMYVWAANENYPAWKFSMIRTVAAPQAVPANK